MANQTIGTLQYDLTLDNSGLKKGLDSSSSSVKSFGDQTQSAGQKIQQHLAVASTALAGIAVGLTAYAKNATDYTVESVKAAKSLGTQLGVSATEASRLTAALGHMGIQADSARQLFGIFEKQIHAATETTDSDRIAHEKLQIAYKQTGIDIKNTTDEIAKNGDQTGALHLKLQTLNLTLQDQQQQLNSSSNAFQRLGISVLDGNGKQKDFNTLLFEVADKFKSLPNGIDKTSTAMELFGKQGKDMIKVLNLGSDGIKDLENQADKLGLTLNAGTINAVNGLVQSQKLLKEQTDALKISVGTATAPALTKYNEMLNRVTKSLLDTSGPLHTVIVDMLAFGGPVSGAASSFTGFLANLDQAKPALKGIGSGLVGVVSGMGWWIVVIGAVIAAVVIIVHQLGGLHQVLLDLQPVINFVKNAWSDFVFVIMAFKPIVEDIGHVFMQQIVPALDQVWQSLSRLWQAINPAFTDVLKVLAVIAGAILVTAIFLVIGAIDLLARYTAFAWSAIAIFIGWISNVIQWLGNFYGSIIDTIGAFARWASAIPQHLENAKNAILNAFNGAKNWLYNAGSDVVNGLVNGLEDSAYKVFKKVESIGSEAVKKLKGVLKIFSPSKVFHEIGAYIGTGLANGIDSMQGAVGDASANLANAVMSPDPFNAILSTGGAASGSGQSITNSTSSEAVNYNFGAGSVVLATAEATDAFFKIGNRNTQLQASGISTLAGTTRV